MQVIEIQSHIKILTEFVQTHYIKNPWKTAIMTEWRREEFNNVKGLNDDYLI